LPFLQLFAITIENPKGLDINKNKSTKETTIFNEENCRFFLEEPNGLDAMF